MRWVVYWSLFVASFKMFVRNRAALFFSLFVPLLIMLIFGVLNFGGTTTVSLGLVDEPRPMAAVLWSPPCSSQRHSTCIRARGTRSWSSSSRGIATLSW